MKRSATLAVILTTLALATGLAIAAGKPFPGQKFKKPIMISHYAAGALKCWSSGTSIVDTPVKDGFTVFQYDEHNRRLWIDIGGATVSGDLVLGSDATCLFTGVRSSPLD
jgi:hypothetical protein